nr:MAG TPA: hypothetical protein [Caudoviricetes sp.]
MRTHRLIVTERFLRKSISLLLILELVILTLVSKS